nr:MAG TPA: hypothetical protein [Bacteriophage sp.]
MIFVSVSILRHFYRHEFDGIFDLFYDKRKALPSNLPIEKETTKKYNEIR